MEPFHTVSNHLSLRKIINKLVYAALSYVGCIACQGHPCRRRPRRRRQRAISVDPCGQDTYEQLVYIEELQPREDPEHCSGCSRHSHSSSQLRDQHTCCPRQRSSVHDIPSPAYYSS